MAKPPEPSDAVTRAIELVRGGAFTESELTLLLALVDVRLEKNTAEASKVTLAGKLGEAIAKLATTEAKHAPKKRGRPRLPKNHVAPLEEKHLRALDRLVEAGDRGLKAEDFKLRGLNPDDRSLYRVLTRLRERHLVDLVGKHWFWTPTGERRKK